MRWDASDSFKANSPKNLAVSAHSSSWQPPMGTTGRSRWAGALTRHCASLFYRLPPPALETAQPLPSLGALRRHHRFSLSSPQHRLDPVLPVPSLLVPFSPPLSGPPVPTTDSTQISSSAPKFSSSPFSSPTGVRPFLLNSPYRQQQPPAPWPPTVVSATSGSATMCHNALYLVVMQANLA